MRGTISLVDLSKIDVIEFTVKDIFELSGTIPIGPTFTHVNAQLRLEAGPVVLERARRWPVIPHRGSVLVVEDEVLIRLTIVDELLEQGFEVFEAGSADEAIAKLERYQHIQLVFTDIDMPGSMDGLKLANFVRGRWPPIKIIVTSGRFLPSSDALPTDVKFFAKPYDYAALISEFDRHLGA